LAGLLETAQQVSEQPGFFNVLLVGSNHLEATLERPEHAALAKLIRVRCQLLPLTPSQVAGYVWYHLGAAGLDSNWFTPDAVSEIASSSRGLPRLINIVGDRTVQAALAAGIQTVDAPFVRQCRGDVTAMAVPELPEPAAFAEDAEAQDASLNVADPDRRWRLLRVGAVAAVGVVLALGLLAYMGPRSAPLDAGTTGAGKAVELPERAPEPLVAPSMAAASPAISPAAVTDNAVRPPVQTTETMRSESAVATPAAAAPPRVSASQNGDRPRVSTTPNGERGRAVVREKPSAPPQVGASTPSPAAAPEQATVNVKPSAPESGVSSASPPTAPSPRTTSIRQAPAPAATDDRDPSAIVDWLLQQRRPE
jgi:hypothetical protein